MEVKNNKAMEFLLYSYFGIESTKKLESKAKEDITDNKKKCAYRAYRDLARTVKYAKLSSELEKASKEKLKSFNELKEQTIKRVCNIITEELDKYEKNEYFDSWHSNVCDKIKEVMNNAKDEGNIHLLKKDFTYGQAQKWLNMTLKYYWLLELLPNKELESHIHVPVDNYIIETVWNVRFWNELNLWKEDNHSKNRNTLLKSNQHDSSYFEKYSIDKCVSWSSWEEQEYKTFQKALKEYINKNIESNNKSKLPIEWESEIWIKTAIAHVTKV